MKYLPLIWSGIWRKRGRATLMLMQVLVAFLLFGLLQGVKTGIDHVVNGLRADLYFVVGAQPGSPLPLALEQRIRAVKGVKQVYAENIFLATYQRPTQRLAVFATDFDTHWAELAGVKVSEGAAARLLQDRTGALVNATLAARYHWKIGETIPLQSTTAKRDGSTNWAVQDVGTFTTLTSSSKVVGGLDNVIVIRNDYFEQARLRQHGTALEYILTVADPHQGERIARQIDALSANSSYETRTTSQRAGVQTRLQSLGDLNFIVRAVVAAAMFALLVSSSAMMMQSVRERTGELAVLKTVGFSDRKVFALLLAESVTLSLVGAAIGLAIASQVVPRGVRGLILAGIGMPGSVVLAGFVIALILALAGAILPAWRGLRLQVAEALAGR